MSSCNHEQGLGRELGAARAGLVAAVGAGHVVKGISDAVFGEQPLCIAERCYWTFRRRAATCAPELVAAEL